ncbi:MAG: MBOAT family protein [Oscillospiraceae bacterium]|nr:MBOAT family protein [Oscillospiraceae bacterium]
MAFNDLSFLFLFFPAALLLHAIAPRPVKNLVLTALSLVFFAWGSVEYVVLMLLSILFNYFSGTQMAAWRRSGDRRMLRFTLISAVTVNLLLLGFFKYWGFVISNINALFGASLAVPDLPMPIGVSFFTFSILSYLFDVYHGRTREARSIVNFALFVTFFPKLVSGPIVQYADFETQLKARKAGTVRFGRASRLFLIGLAKKVILSNTLGTTFYALSGQESVSVVSAWLGAVSYALMLYFDFSGYSDMAIALGEMFGFRFVKNFDYPYLSSSITEFWRRWHISLGAWFRDYVYIPLGGSRVGTLKNIRNLFAVWLLTGVWHGASWNFIFWGLYYGVLLFLEKYVLQDVLKKVPTILRHAATLLLVLIGWVFFFSPSLGSAFSWLGAMFGIGAAGFIDGMALYHLGSSWLLILIGAFAAFPMGAKLGSRIYRQGTAATAASILWFALLLALCIAGMMSSTYSSFLYFQF